MNIQTRNIRQGRRTNRRTAEGLSIGTKLFVVLNVAIALSAVFLIANYRISLNQNISGIEAQSARYQQKIHELNREIETLQVRREKLCAWTHIRDRVAQLGLDLRMPDPFQVQRLVVNFEDQPVSSGNAVDNKLAMRQDWSAAGNVNQ
ncbi:hypothetical protein P0136_10845 [Lentisphaerota bacterium ZTH]|nr:hypothetical protein JYG24_11635 [Lentisphaerota bacterium]WET05859.1 hypothetical protein P0136_10845 [Lentisphaerota bacterium ZTH]